MPSVKDLKRRIGSLKKTSQITKAMEAVSASKMRKSQQAAITARPYAAASLEMLKNLVLRTSELPPLLSGREVKTRLLLTVTSDKGLAGALNSNVLKLAEKHLKENKDSGKEYRIMAVGRKAKEFFERNNIFPEESYIKFGDFTGITETLPISQKVIQGFLAGYWDEVYAVFTNFRTTLFQEAVIRKILPVTLEGVEEAVRGILPEHGRYTGEEKKKESAGYNYEYKFEPSPAEVLGTLAPKLISMHIHHIILEANASEHSARMVAMKNASENAKDLIGDLTLSYNKARQAGITKELTEIVAGL